MNVPLEKLLQVNIKPVSCANKLITVAHWIPIVFYNERQLYMCCVCACVRVFLYTGVFNITHTHTHARMQGKTSLITHTREPKLE